MTRKVLATSQLKLLEALLVNFWLLSLRKNLREFLKNLMKTALDLWTLMNFVKWWWLSLNKYFICSPLFCCISYSFEWITIAWYSLHCHCLSCAMFFSLFSESRVANVCLSIGLSPKPLCLSESLLSTIEHIDHLAYQPSSLLSLLTSCLLSRLLSLSACF